MTMIVSTSLIYAVIAGICAFLILHIAIWRLNPSDNPRILLLGLLGLTGMVVASVTHWRLQGVDVYALCGVWGIHVFGLIAYIFVYAGIARSVSVTLLARLLDCPDRKMGFDALVEEYAHSNRFEDRIHLMVQNGLIQLDGDYASLTPQGYRMARWAKWLGAFIGEGLQG